MVTVLYAVISAFIIGKLSLNVIKVRRKERINVGDNDNKNLIYAMSAQSNAVEYLPIAIILLFSLEINGGHVWAIHGFGIAIITGRVLHYRAMKAHNLVRRVVAMHITLYAIFSLAITNMFYLPYDRLFG